MKMKRPLQSKMCQLFSNGFHRREMFCSVPKKDSPTLVDVNTDAFQRRALARSRVLDQINFECRPILADGPPSVPSSI